MVDLTQQFLRSNVSLYGKLHAKMKPGTLSQAALGSIFIVCSQIAAFQVHESEHKQKKSLRFRRLIICFT